MTSSPPVAATATAPAPPPPRRRRSRVLVTIVGVLAALVLAAVVADRAMAARASDRFAERLQSSADLASPPEVELGGVGAGLRAARGRVGEVTVTADDVVRGRAAGAVRLSRVRAQLSGVSGERGKGLTAEHATVTAVVGWDDLGARIARGARNRHDATAGPDAVAEGSGGRAGLLDGATLGSGGDGLVAVRRTATVLGQQVPVTVFLRPALDGGRLTFTPIEVEVLGTRRSGAKLLDRLGGADVLSRTLPTPPGGLAYTAVTATDAGLELTMAGDDVHLDREGLAR